VEIEKVVRKFLGEMGAQILERKVRIEVSDEAVAWLAEKGFDPQMGARPLDRTIQEHIKKPLSSLILFGDLSGGGLAKVEVNEDKTDLTITATATREVNLEKLLEVVPEEENLKLAK
jgi:ATP-dependent Clp protease ATP-binding subunit ClpA